MDRQRKPPNHPSSAANKWGAGRPPPPPLSMKEGLPSDSSGYGRHFVLEDRPKIDALLSLGIRFLQCLFALVSFCIMAASKQSFSWHTGFTKMSMELQFSDFKPFSFLVAGMGSFALWILLLFQSVCCTNLIYIVRLYPQCILLQAASSLCLSFNVL